MELPCTRRRAFWSFTIYAILLSLSEPAAPTSLGNVTDRIALLAFKHQITQDPFQALSSWNDSLHFCQWLGVTCSRRHQRVTVLNLPSLSLAGTLSPHITNLTFLKVINLSYNSFHGGIPLEIDRLFRLHRLVLHSNSFEGEIPANLSNCAKLTLIDFSSNSFVGKIPFELGSLSNLRELNLFINGLTGSIPPSFGNLSSLLRLSLRRNGFDGSIPSDLGRLKKLQFFQIAENKLSGTIPSSIYNLSDIYILSVSFNQLHGTLPSNLALTLPNLQLFYVSQNRFSGPIPVSLSNASNLEELYFTNNLLEGNIPVGIGKLRKITELGFSGNRFSGEIPSSIGNMTELSELYLQENNLQGSIPSSLGNCKKLSILNISHNNLSGAIPKQVISISSLSISLNLAQNSLTGSLPLEVGSLKSLRELDVSENKLTGEIPTTLGNCVSLGRLFMQSNFFNGTIPSSLSALRSIEVLDLSHNNLTGQIPEFLEKLLSLQNLNLSFNSFEGALPKEGVFGNASTISVLGNRRLCGGGVPELQLPKCLTQVPKGHGRSFYLAVFVPVITVAVCLIFSPCLCAVLYGARKSRKKHSSTSSMEDQYTTISYSELHKATDEFSLSNLIGMGSYGSVYKGKFASVNTIVAIKVLSLQEREASKNFIGECESLINVRHRNLVKILASCSTIDFKGYDFKALVFEFMPNGSLEEWLHPKDGYHQLRSLSLVQRVNIAVDVASALDYLHNHFETSIVHCDLKPTNVLLDNDMVAHVGDFGLAKILIETSNNLSRNDINSIAIKSSIGYVAPEYGMGRNVSTHGDVYSYGILLLELVTGRRPTENMFKDGLSLHEFTRMVFPSRVMEIADPRLLEEKVQEDDVFYKFESTKDERQRMIDCFVSIVRIALACSMEMPRERMQMKDVVNEIQVIRDKFLAVGIYRDEN